MNLYAEVTSERASKGEALGGQEYILIDLNVHREKIGQVELYYFDDSKDCESNEWVLKYRPDDETDWVIIAQGNITPPKKGERQKGKIGLNEKTYPDILRDWQSRE